MDATVAKIREAMRTRNRLHHVALNVAKLVEIGYNKELRDDVHAADIVGIDGMGILLALRMNSVDVPERVAGIDLMRRVLQMCAVDGFKPYFLGAEAHVVTKAAEIARRDCPGLQIAGIHDGYFTPDDEAAIVAEIKASGADCLFVGMPTPRKERFLAKHRAQLDVPFIMGVGGSFDVMAGKVQRAPEVMQRYGFEWLYRVFQEPRRMWWRYARTNTLFALMMGTGLAEKFANTLTLAGGPRQESLRATAAGAALAPGGWTRDPAAASVPNGAGAPRPGGSAAGRVAHDVAASLRVPGRVITDALVALELLCIVVASQLAIKLYAFGWFSPGLRDVDYLLPSIVCALIAGRQLSVRGHLSISAMVQRQSGEWRKILAALTEAFLVTLALAYIFQLSAQYSRGWLATWFVLSAVSLVVARFGTRRLLRWLYEQRAIERRVAVISSGPLPAALRTSILAEPGITLARHHALNPAQLMAHPDSAGAISPLADAPWQPPIEDLIQQLIRDDVEDVVLVDRDFTAEQLSWLVRQLNVLPVSVLVQPASFETGLAILGVERLGMGNVLKVSGVPQSNWGLVAKTVFDFTFSLVGLVILSPLLALIALAIKLDSKGPVLFRQRRNGFYESEINVIKFRTMHVQEDNGVIRQAQADDARVTRVGWFLRRTSLDELPQLLNVVRGEMSLVGPRPHALQHNEIFRQYVSRYTARHRVKPGITGLSQINGLRGECKTADFMRRRVEMDIYYIDKWSLWLDLRILLLTPIFGLIGRNAY
jgi:Undecaprenyl-phosphate glucose phosphotransferase